MQPSFYDTTQTAKEMLGLRLDELCAKPEGEKADRLGMENHTS
jgi:hypothetical protein